LGFFGLKTNHLATLNSGGVHFAKVPSRNNKKNFLSLSPELPLLSFVAKKLASNNPVFVQSVFQDLKI
jgi:hypothetical protein